MNQVDLPVKSRSKASKNGNRRLRGSGEVPAVLYGGPKGPELVALKGQDFEHMLRTLHRSTIFNLKLDGGTPQPAIIKALQRDPVREGVIHVDFYRIEMDKAITVQVPIHSTGGVPAGVKLGGVFSALLRKIEIRCLPLQVPASFDVDVSGLGLNKSLHVSDLVAPEGVEILTAKTEAIFNCVVPKAEEEKKVEVVEGAAPAAAAGAAPAGAAPAADAKKGEAKKGDDKKPEAKKPEAKKPEAKKK